MNEVLTILLLLILPFSSFSQVVSDSTFTSVKIEEDFSEYYWQNDVRILKDSAEFSPYKVEYTGGLNKIEIIDGRKNTIWYTEDFSQEILISSSILTDSSYTVRAYSTKGITEIIWHRKIKSQLVLNR
jgi:hypothetical protein